ncbi:rRNA pseudouridine synthase [Candidatus Uhrbacteria bacterium]|nr:rRNA pseudouridine synthase [Candidatus Uhrbacteria bacterium]
MQIRINKFLADKGIASRRAIDAMIADGRITVNGGRLEKPGYLVQKGDRITIDGKAVSAEQKKEYVYILLNKPAGCITTSKDTHGRKTVLDYVKIRKRIFPIGRLDKDTTGVLPLTNDGDLANALMHPRHEVEKVYRAYVNKPFSAADKKRFESGIMLDNRSARGGSALGGKTAPCTTRFFRNNRRDVIITIHEGRNRQIHRMFNALGVTVERLDRMSYAGLTVGRLKQGEWRHLSPQEIKHIKSL